MDEAYRKTISVLKEIVKESNQIMPYVMVAQPRRDLSEKPAQKLEGYDSIHIDMSGFSRGFCHIGGQKVDVARNWCCERALESGAKYMLFVGEDTVLPYNGFMKLHETAEQNPDAMVVGVYYIKLSVPMVMIRTGDHVIPANVDPGQVIDCWQTGLDCALIPTKILQAMKDEDPDLPFTCVAMGIKDEQGEEIPFIGEDNFFVYRLRKLGFKVLCNTDVQCVHMDLATGKYSAHPDVDLGNYYTNIPITERFVLEDKKYVDGRWTRDLGKCPIS
jgi:hypothetical protein